MLDLSWRDKCRYLSHDPIASPVALGEKTKSKIPTARSKNESTCKLSVKTLDALYSMTDFIEMNGLKQSLASLLQFNY